MLFIQCDHGSTLYSKVRKMGCQDTKHIGILSNQVQGCQLKKLLKCWNEGLEFYSREYTYSIVPHARLGDDLRIFA